MAGGYVVLCCIVNAVLWLVRTSSKYHHLHIVFTVARKRSLRIKIIIIIIIWYAYWYCIRAAYIGT